ncbi:MAG: radical SAM protein [Prevotellaceae bacterium]|jgi:wyosine [tRNA(Phe)-imidazoG37] synthetase (radical SAM superfamily)|nr:radical SAM protein [Prevotellaceae bacterium]
MLFSSTVFGPVKSRRLGVSLGINLLPNEAKICSFNCIYCECGYNTVAKNAHIPSREEVRSALETKLIEMKTAGEKPDVLTFAGNGEPTLHPDFEGVIDDTISLRNQYFPNAKVSVLSNSSEISKESVFRALLKVDNNILKLDSAIENTIKILDRPNAPHFSAEKLIENLCRFNGKLIVQTMFVRGTHEGNLIDNTTETELSAWLAALQKIKPAQVMIYTIDRATPEKNLQKVSVAELKTIAERVKKIGIDVQVSG